MTERQEKISSAERLGYRSRLEKAVKIGMAASVLALPQLAESGAPVSPGNRLYQESKTDDTINVAIVDYTDGLDAELLESETEAILQQALAHKDAIGEPYQIDIDVDVHQSKGLDAGPANATPSILPISPFWADRYLSRTSMSLPANLPEYESVVGVVAADEGARSMQLTPHTRYSHVTRHFYEQEREIALTTAHELGHQFEIGHVWAYDPGKVLTDLAGRKFISIHDNSGAADYNSYDRTTGNLMGSTAGEVKKDEAYQIETVHASEKEATDHKELHLAGMQIDKLYEHTDGFIPLGIELKPDSEHEETTIAITPGQSNRQYVKAAYPEGVSWDENAKFDTPSGYAKIAINSLVLEPISYEHDGETMVDYRLYLADDGNIPQMLYMNRAYEAHSIDEDSNQTVSVNGLAFQTEYDAATRSMHIEARDNLSPMGGS